MGDVGSTGCLVEAAVEGLTSWAGDGCRLIDADCIAEAMSMAGFDMMGEIGRMPHRNVLKYLNLLEAAEKHRFDYGLHFAEQFRSEAR